jgi:hypothetical protein
VNVSVQASRHSTRPHPPRPAGDGWTAASELGSESVLRSRSYFSAAFLRGQRHLGSQPERASTLSTPIAPTGSHYYYSIKSLFLFPSISDTQNRTSPEAIHRSVASHIR